MNYFVRKNGEYSRLPIKRKWYYSPAQAILHRLYPDIPEYSFPDEYKDIISSDWMPLVDIVDTEAFVILKVELPGVEKENVSVTIHDGELWIQGERRFDNKEIAKIYCCEGNYGIFYRRIKLMDSLETNKVVSELKNGILTIQIPKMKKVNPKAISIK